MTIGERIKARRIELNLSQEELAKRLGYKSRSSINKIELDQRNLTQSKIKAIADALETTPSYIMGWLEEEKQKNPVTQEGNGISKKDAEFLEVLHNIPEDMQDAAIRMLRGLANKQ